MEDIKLIIAKNITDLRRATGMTQSELAEKLNYTDKAVSKWERGLSVPDIVVLKSIADLFGVTVDYLITAEHEGEPAPTALPEEEPADTKKRRFANRSFIMGMSIVLVWLVATLVFVILELIFDDLRYHWLSFAYAIPVSAIVWLVFNSVWFNARLNFFIISCLMWSGLAVVALTLFLVAVDPWLIFILGIPGQIIILMWSRIKRIKKS